VYQKREIDQSSIRDQYLIAQVQREIASVVGPEHVNTDATLLHEQSADWSWISQYLKYKSLPVPTADIYVRPGTAEEVAEVLRIACEYKIPVVPRGGGSGTQGGTFAIYGGIAMDLRRLNKVLHIDEVSMVVTAEAGIEGPELEKILNAKGLTMPHYPGSFHFGATLGGYLAARGSGVVSTKYGKAEDLVLQLEAAVPPGKLIETMKVPNHASGPGIMQAIVGSEGTLGIITKASMRIERIPETDTCARFEDLEKIYWAKKKVIEEGFAEYKARYTAHFSHWFPWGGMIYDRFYIDNGPEDPQEAIALHDRVWDAAIKASLDNGGSLNEHHGVGLKLGRFMRVQHGAAFDLLLGVKDAWDPDGILNPGKLGFGPPKNGRY